LRISELGFSHGEGKIAAGVSLSFSVNPTIDGYKVTRGWFVSISKEEKLLAFVALT
jgi:hypothetical protein